MLMTLLTEMVSAYVDKWLQSKCIVFTFIWSTLWSISNTPRLLRQIYHNQATLNRPLNETVIQEGSTFQGDAF